MIFKPLPEKEEKIGVRRRAPPEVRISKTSEHHLPNGEMEGETWLAVPHHKSRGGRLLRSPSLRYMRRCPSLRTPCRGPPSAAAVRVCSRRRRRRREQAGTRIPINASTRSGETPLLCFPVKKREKKVQL